MLEEQIFSDYQEALKTKDVFKVETLRFLRSVLLNTAIEKRRRNLEDNEVIAIIRKQIKNINEAMEEYKRAGRQDLVERSVRERNTQFLFALSFI
ncbi:MAG: GatB/YqeY domain-containing protein [Candidatus Omnitrophica bacterium]|nr:GatB/YqeY domain-containing protein [Candidatus Omnitrophota bacterium]